jgi:hypothetical protein
MSEWRGREYFTFGLLKGWSLSIVIAVLVMLIVAGIDA